MKGNKPVKKATTRRSNKPLGRTPVISARVPEFLYVRIKASAAASGRPMSDEIAALIIRGFEWGDVFHDRAELLRLTKIECDRMRRGPPQFGFIEQTDTSRTPVEIPAGPIPAPTSEADELRARIERLEQLIIKKEEN